MSDRRMFYAGVAGTMVVELDGTTHLADPADPDLIAAQARMTELLAGDAEEWRDHIPSGYEDMIGYGQVSCSCGWDSSDKLGWEEHIDAAMAVNRARTEPSEPSSGPSTDPDRA